jgi:hypothetical protein
VGTSNEESLEQVFQEDLLESTDHFQVLPPRNFNLPVAVLSEDFKGLWQTTKELIAVKNSRKLGRVKTAFGPMMVGTVDE